jgi:hypothetical protein
LAIASVVVVISETYLAQAQAGAPARACDGLRSDAQDRFPMACDSNAPHD